MASKVVDIRPELQKRRRRKGWTIAEIEQRAAREAEAYRRQGKDEPGNLASGIDMKKIISGEADHDDVDEE